MSAKPTTVEAYLRSVPEPARATLERVRESIRAAAPDAAESIAYGMPAFKYKGKPLMYYAASKHHCALYGPAKVSFEEDLAGYDVSKGTIRFPQDKPLPKALVKKLVVSRIKEIDAAESARKTTKAAAR